MANYDEELKLSDRIDDFKMRHTAAKRKREEDNRTEKLSLFKRERLAIIEAMEAIADDEGKEVIVSTRDVCDVTRAWFTKQHGAKFVETFGIHDEESFSYWTIKFE